MKKVGFGLVSVAVMFLLIGPEALATDYLWQLTDFPGDELFPDWSPDGSKIAYAYEGDIWTIPPKGGTPTRITTDSANDGFPDWSPDWSEVVFVSEGDGSLNLWKIPSGGGEATQLTFDGWCYQPCWSPDGSTIAFDCTFSFPKRSIATIPSTGGEPTVLTDFIEYDYNPTWSPDGSIIAFHSWRTGNHDIWAVPSGGGDIYQITDFEGSEREPDWSWTADRIAYAWSDPPHEDKDIYTVPGGGGTPRRVTYHEADDRYPSWSPDGEHIVFSSDRGGDFDIWIIKEQYQAIEPTSVGRIKALFK